MAISKCFSIGGSEALLFLYLEDGKTTPHVLFIHPDGQTLLMQEGDIDAIGSQLFDACDGHDYPKTVVAVAFGTEELKITLLDAEHCEFVCKEQGKEEPRFKSLLNPDKLLTTLRRISTDNIWPSDDFFDGEYGCGLDADECYPNPEA